MNTSDEKEFKSGTATSSTSSDSNHQQTKPPNAQSTVEPILESTMDDINRYYRPDLLSNFNDFDLYQVTFN